MSNKNTKECAKHNLVNNGYQFINKSIFPIEKVETEIKSIKFIYLKLLYKNNLLVVAINVEIVNEYLVNKKIYTGVEYLNEKLKKIFIEGMVLEVSKYIKITDFHFIGISKQPQLVDWMWLKIKQIKNGYIKISCGKWLKYLDLENTNKINFKCLVEQYRLYGEIASIKSLSEGDIVLLNTADSEIRLWEPQNNLFSKLTLHQNNCSYKLNNNWYKDMTMKSHKSNLKAKISFVIDELTLNVDDLSGFSDNQYIKLEKQLNESIDIYVNGYRFGQGKLVAIEDHYGVKITSLCS
ncbi:FliM/FliN family flagellar motor switch protein [Spartinivicinus marinus]|uniref:FliM/FliN family flagellar motor switch protein n=1 Tax=Spartinivicinus marinus TaxID=2994442 RepID=UPI0015D854E2|nr:FliM/FliN family flagellar motor switch protein [Spartinivicinus marinus]MCX4029076.1 FliM/FliN family flagellar motor switch protein [Spartinivicinus marinus]